MLTLSLLTQWCSKQALCSENINSHIIPTPRVYSSLQTTHRAVGSSPLRAQACTSHTKPDLCRVYGKEALYLAAVMPKHFAPQTFQVPLCSDPHLCGRELWPAGAPRLTITTARLWLHKWSLEEV